MTSREMIYFMTVFQGSIEKAKLSQYVKGKGKGQ